MQFTTPRLLAFTAAISQALAKVILTNTNWDVTAGQPFTITWSGASGAVELLLKNGASGNLNTVSTIATGLTGTSYSWTPSGLPTDTYAIEIQDSADVNYSEQFAYTGTAVATPTSTTESSTTTTDTSSTTTTSSLNTATAAATASGKPTGTTTSKTSSTSTATSSTSTATNSPLNTNGSQKMGSPLALVFLTVASLMLFH